MKTAYILVGHSYTGKSSFIKNQKDIFVKKDFVIISSDFYLEAHMQHYNKSYDEVWKEHIKEVTKRSDEDFKSAIQFGYDIIIDKTNMSKKSRAKWIKPLLKADYDIVCIVFKHLSEKELHLRRVARPDKFISDYIIEDMINRYEEPCINEGFSHIMFNK